MAGAGDQATEGGHQPAPYAEVLHNEAGANCAAFITRAGAFMARYGITIERVMSDNAFAYYQP